MARYGVVTQQSIVLTEGKSSFTNIVTKLARGAIVQVLEEGTDGWGRVQVDGTSTQGYAILTHFKLTDTYPTPPPPESSYEVVVRSPANLRSGAGVQYPVISTAVANQTLIVLGSEIDWLKVSLDGGIAYISTHLTERKDANQLQGFLIDLPALMNYELAPKRQIPTQELIEGKRPFACARVWNNYGGLLETLSQRLQIPVSTLVATISAESSGKAFGSDNRLFIRFEVHVFYQEWGKNNQALFDKHFQCDGWKSHKFRLTEADEWRAVHTGHQKEWEVLEFARALDDTAALKSISMGAPQMMGFNYKILGYESVQEMFESFARSANAQILSLFDFVRSRNAIQPLQSGDLLSFATIYNGPANAHTYSAIIEDYIGIFNELIKTATETPDIQTQLRGPADVGKTVPPAPVEEVEKAGTPESVPTVTATATAVQPAQAETVIYAREAVNVRSAESTSASALGALARGTVVKLRESVESAVQKIEAGETAGKFIAIDYNGQNGFVASWLMSPAKQLTAQSVLNYIDQLPQRPIPAEYDLFWSHRDKLGLPDPFDVLPVQITSEAELVNMQVNGFGPNTFSLYNGAVWYDRIGYMHNGYDFIVKTGTPLLAVSDGIIIKKWQFMANPAEKTVVLWCFLPERFRDAQGRRMMSNVIVAYGHMSNSSLRKHLEVVKAGDVIGLSGTPAGMSTNDHLHYEVHLLQGDPNLPNQEMIIKRRLAEFKRDSNSDNKTPWNALLFYTKRIVQYSLHQGETIGFGRGKNPEYPTLDMLKAQKAQHLHPLSPFSLAYYRYGISNVWKAPTDGKQWREGVVTLPMLEERLANFPTFEPYPMPE